MTNKRETPAEVLAKRIGNRMVEERLLHPDREDNFLSKLVLGKLKESDWKLAIEAIPQQSKKQLKRR